MIPISLSFSSQRAHHPAIPFGAWKLCFNGIQFFAGKYALTVHWPIKWGAWSKCA